MIKPAILYKGFVDNIRYLENSNDPEVKNVVNEDLKLNNEYWVYSKYNNEVYPCDCGGHTDTIAKVATEFYGKTLQGMADEQVERFITNFTTRSDNLTVRCIAKSHNVKISAKTYT